MKTYTILEIGTNSIKFFVAGIANDHIKVFEDSNNISRLGEGLYKTGNISEDAIKRNIDALRGFLDISKKYNPGQVITVGTMGLRTAKNAQEFIEKVKNELGLEIKVLTGEDEARFSYLAAISAIAVDDKDILVFDTGGGSTEFIYGKGDKLKERFSLNIGAVQPTEKYLRSNPVTDQEWEKCNAVIRGFLKENLLDRKVDRIVGIGGTVTSMGAIKHHIQKYDAEKIQGSQLTLVEVQGQIAMFREKTIEQRKEIIGLQPKRADVILAGAAIVMNILLLNHKEHFFLSDRGLRHGIIFDQMISLNKQSGSQQEMKMIRTLLSLIQILEVA